MVEVSQLEKAWVYVMKYSVAQSYRTGAHIVFCMRVHTLCLAVVYSTVRYGLDYRTMMIDLATRRAFPITFLSPLCYGTNCACIIATV
jgi:hypothetical protein